jgi:hypothetical protein
MITIIAAVFLPFLETTNSIIIKKLKEMPDHTV